MEQVVRKTFFGLSFLGLLAGLLAYVASFWGVQLESTVFLLAVGLHLGVFLTYGPVVIAERDVINRGLYLIYPEPVRTVIRRTAYVLFTFFLFQFVLLAVLTRGHSLQTMNGEFMLGGGAVKVISKAEYDRLKGHELRMFASLWIVAYFATAAYWWFPKQRYLILPIGGGVPEKQ